MFRKIVVCMTIFSLVCVPIFSQPTPAHADGDDAANIASYALHGLSVIANSVSASALSMLSLKEWTLDGVAWAIVRQITKQMVRSTIQWINSGFNGSPLFVTDPEAFLLSIADQAAGEIIYGSALGALCSPINIRIALDIYYRSQTGRLAPRCTLSRVISNVENASLSVSMGGGAGSYYGGSASISGFGGRSPYGWDDWFSMVNAPMNTSLGSLLYAQEELDRRIASRQSINRMQWDWGRGFLSRKECSVVGGAEKCRTVTPGDTIAEAINFQLSVPGRELISADEINEMISALLSQLGMQALSAAGGLFGLTQPQYSYSGYATGVAADKCAQLSYLDQLNDKTCSTMIGGASESDSFSKLVADSLKAENEYQNLQEKIVNKVVSVFDYIEANDLVCSANEHIIDDLTDIRTVAEKNIVSSNLRSQKVLALQSATDPETAQKEFSELLTSDTFQTPIKINLTAQKETQDTLAEIEALQENLEECPSDKENGNSSFDSSGA